jgi:hypothetical protein
VRFPEIGLYSQIYPKGEIMKAMTCKQLGGPCELIHTGADANVIVKSQDKHLRGAVASGDSAHEDALKAMKGRWKNPIKGMGWYNQVKKDFAAL